MSENLTTAAPTDEPAHEMCIMDRTGDLKVIWDPDKEDEVEAARKQFNDLRKKGYAAYKVEGKKGDKGEVIREFDPDAGRIILAPAMQGG